MAKQDKKKDQERYIQRTKEYVAECRQRIEHIFLYNGEMAAQYTVLVNDLEEKYQLPMAPHKQKRMMQQADLLALFLKARHILLVMAKAFTEEPLVNDEKAKHEGRLICAAPVQYFDKAPDLKEDNPFQYSQVVESLEKQIKSYFSRHKVNDIAD